MYVWICLQILGPPHKPRRYNTCSISGKSTLNLDHFTRFTCQMVNFSKMAFPAKQPCNAAGSSLDWHIRTRREATRDTWQYFYLRHAQHLEIGALHEQWSTLGSHCTCHMHWLTDLWPNTAYLQSSVAPYIHKSRIVTWMLFMIKISVMVQCSEVHVRPVYDFVDNLQGSSPLCVYSNGGLSAQPTPTKCRHFP